MSETSERIPDDLLKAAEDALDNMLCNCRESCGSDAAVRAESIKDIARALLAERERSARKAESTECDPKHDGIVVEIAAAIRA